eukprot:12418181-Karenia_brevis.AAC.1
MEASGCERTNVNTLIPVTKSRDTGPHYLLVPSCSQVWLGWGHVWAKLGKNGYKLGEVGSSMQWEEFIQSNVSKKWTLCNTCGLEDSSWSHTCIESGLQVGMSGCHF